MNSWPADELESVPACPVCGCQHRDVLHDELEDALFKAAPGRWTLFRCTACRNAWLDPRPTMASIGRAYSGYYTHDAADHPIVRRQGRLRSFLHDAMNGYRNARYGLARQPALCMGRWLIPLFPSLQAAVDAECRHLPHPPAGGGRLLDVGFGNGGFLRIAEEAGWDAEGIDFDSAAVEVARSRGLNVRCGTIDSLSENKSSYDIITLSHVIEHLHDPASALRGLFDLLKPGGVLWLDTPNLSSKGHHRFGRNWRDLDPPRHLVIFRDEGLIKLLLECGFRSIKRRWRGLSVFDVFPVSEALELGADPWKASRQGKPRAREMLAEMDEMLRQKKREFITLTACKPESP